MRSTISRSSSHSHSKKQPSLEVVRTCKACYRLDGCACLPCQDYLSLDSLLSTSTTTTTTYVRRLDDLETIVSQRRNELLMRINESHDPVTRHLPVELISVIFGFSLPERMGFQTLDHLYQYHPQIHHDLRGTSKTDRYGRRHIESGPLLLGAVCRSWRRIAWATPQIWTTIPISLRNLDKHKRNRLDTLRGWFERAGQLPLSIQVSCPDTLYEECKEWMPDDPFFRLLNQSSDRWYKLEIQGPSWVVGFFSGNSQVGAPNLSTLTLYPRQGDQFNFGIKASRKFKVAAPKFVSVSWGSFRWLHINWGHTTEVTAEFSLDECVELMRQAPQLTKCSLSIGINSGFFPLPQDGDFIIHDNLQSLELLFNRFDRDSNADGNTQFLDSLSFPRLGELKFDKNITLSWERVLDHLQRSCCELISLEIKQRCEFNELATVLWKTPSLRRLRITDVPLDFFKLLSSDTVMLPLLLSSTLSSDAHYTNNGLGVFLPNLEHLNVWPYLDSITEKFWYHALNIFGPAPKARSPHFHHRPLRKLEINRFWRPEEGVRAIGIDKNVGKRIMELGKVGIVVAVKDWSERYDLLQLAMAHHKIMREF